VYALNGKWQLGDRLSVVGDLSYQDSKFDSQFIAVRTERVPASVSLAYNGGNGFPSWHFNDDSEMLDPSKWNMGQLFENAGHDDGSAATVTLDASYDLSSNSSFFKTLSFGVRYDDRDAVHFQPSTIPAPFLPAPATLAQMPAGMLWTNDDFLDGEASVPTTWLVANGYWIHDHANQVRAMYNAVADGPPLLFSYEVKERTSTAYVQADAQFGDRLQAEVGVRYINVDAPLEFADLVDLTKPRTHSTNKVDDLLPSATLRFKVTEDFRLRAN
jgi:outer membrane receptor protein involved in Fe transport